MMPKISGDRGQTLLLVVLTMAAALTVGLAISSQVIQTTKQTGQTTHYTQAYHAAEAGVEEALANLAANPGYRQVAFPCSFPGCAALDNNAQYRCTVADVAGGYEAGISQDETGTVDLSGSSLNGATIYVDWHNTGLGDSGTAGIGLFLVEDLGGGNYNQARGAYDPNAVAHNNGFSVPTSLVGQPYAYRASVTLTVNDTSRILRIRPLYAGTHVKVTPSAGSIPAQQVRIYCEGRMGPAQPAVEVIRSNPSLPAVFDFALFSASETQDLVK